MHKLPDKLNQQFSDFLINKKLSDKDSHFYKKWLRFYWDFCHKYQHDVFHSGSFPLFLKKLQDKNQSEQQQNQAKQAVSLFFEMRTRSEQPVIINKNDPKASGQGVKHSEVAANHSKHRNDHIAMVQNPVRQRSDDLSSSHSLSVNQELEETGTNWVYVFDQLVNEIKIRHYSPKTLKAYRGYIRQLQTFTKSKDYEKLSQQDVIDFLTFLAVEKQVSAASQNLAFNALLFLFKQVLKKEFGENYLEKHRNKRRCKG